MMTRGQLEVLTKLRTNGWEGEGKRASRKRGTCVKSSKIKNELPYDSATLLLGIYPEELKSGAQGDSSMPLLTAALLTTAKMWQPPNVHPREDGQRRLGTCTRWNTIQPSKRRILQCVTIRTKLEDIMVSEISQSQKGKCCVVCLMWGT